MHPDLTRARPRFVMLELTSRCNLRCLYCALSQPEFHGKDLELGREEVVSQIRAVDPEEVQLNGHGESTLLRDWHLLATDLMNSGIQVSLTTNLALVWNAAELAVLARMKSLTVSCDTADPELFARLRRGSTLARVEQNLELLEAEAARLGVPRPYVALNCTYTDRVVEGLPRLVEWARDRNLDAVSLTNLVEYPQVDPEFPVRHPANVDPAGALASIRRAARIAHDAGIDFNAMGGLIESLELACTKAP